MFTPRRLRTTPKIAARLSMLGLPLSDSILWRLLLGVFVSTASASKPTDAFTRSRKIRRAACGSPFKKSVAASSRSALAKAGSRATRALTVSLKSRVSATSLPLIFGPGFCRCRFSGLVFGEQILRPFYVRLLPFLRATNKKDNESFAVPTQIKSVARPPVDPVFPDRSQPFDVRGIAHFQPQ